MDKQYKFLLPLLFGLMVALGMFLGTKYQPGSRISKDDPVIKLKEVLSVITSSYMDTTSENQLINNAIAGIFDNLDPHSTYIPSNKLENINEQLEGGFEGIGIEFSLVQDTLFVIEIFRGGPAETAGVKQGDKIIYIDDEIISGKKLNNEQLINRLKGKKGSKVRIKVLRQNKSGLTEISITRDKIALSSITACYKINEFTGYIKLSNFSANTYNEFLDSIYKLNPENLHELVLDLTDNPGGYLNTAVDIADEFFSTKKLIVYTEGRNKKLEKFISTSTGSLKKVRLIVIIDENSASASEIFAGAMQDWDRGIILGRRSFGKGLVQQQIPLSDKSAIRLTVARYFTPTGRCIQKPYLKDKNDYFSDLLNRYEQGELTSLDSVKFPKGYKYKTDKGRIVYAGGGIMPDIFVPLDTSENSPYLTKLIKNEVIYRFSVLYMDRHRDQLKINNPSFKDFEKNFKDGNLLLLQLVKFAGKEGYKRNHEEIGKSSNQIVLLLKALIAKQLYGNNYFYQVLNQNNPELNKAIDILNSPDYWKVIHVD